MHDAQQSYYRERVQASLTWSLAAKTPEAARVHMELYTLYIERAGEASRR